MCAVVEGNDPKAFLAVTFALAKSNPQTLNHVADVEGNDPKAFLGVT